MKHKIEKLFDILDLIIERIEKLSLKLISLAGWLTILILAIKGILK